jgi:hypothetical protein
MLNLFQGIDWPRSANAFSWACRYGYFDIVKFFVENLKINIHENEDEALKSASDNCRWDIIKYLIEKGNLKNYSTKIFILSRAIGFENMEMIEYINELNLKNNVQPQIRKIYFSCLAVIAVSVNRLDFLKIVINKVGGVNNTNKKIIYPIFFFAAVQGHIEIMEYLSEKYSIKHLDEKTSYDILVKAAESFHGDFTLIEYLFRFRIKKKIIEKVIILPSVKDKQELFEYLCEKKKNQCTCTIL